MSSNIKKNGGIPSLSQLKKSDLEYYLFFIIIEIAEAINKGASNKTVFLFSITAIFFLCYKLIRSRYRYTELLIVLLLGALSVLIFYNTKKIGGILSIIALLGLKGVDTRKLLKLSFYLRSISFIIVVSLTSIGILQNAKLIHIRGDSSVIRYSMGFSHPNQFHLAFIIILLLYLYFYFQKINAIHITVLCLLNFLIYQKSFSRTSCIIGFFAIFMMVWFRSNVLCKLKNFVCYSILPIGFIVSIVPALLYDKTELIRKVDRLLQWRITFGRHYLEQYPINLFGNNLRNDTIVLDSGYIELIINYGIIFTFFYVIAYLILIHRFVKNRNYRELLLVVCFLSYGVTEAFIPNLFANVSMIFIGELIFPVKTKESMASNKIKKEKYLA